MLQGHTMLSVQAEILVNLPRCRGAFWPVTYAMTEPCLGRLMGYRELCKFRWMLGAAIVTADVTDRVSAPAPVGFSPYTLVEYHVEDLV